MGQRRVVSDATAYASARERARIVQATLRVAASEVNSTNGEEREEREARETKIKKTLKEEFSRRRKISDFLTQFAITARARAHLNFRSRRKKFSSILNF